MYICTHKHVCIIHILCFVCFPIKNKGYLINNTISQKSQLVGSISYTKQYLIKGRYLVEARYFLVRNIIMQS